MTRKSVELLHWRSASSPLLRGKLKKKLVLLRINEMFVWLNLRSIGWSACHRCAMRPRINARFPGYLVVVPASSGSTSNRICNSRHSRSSKLECSPEFWWTFDLKVLPGTIGKGGRVSQLEWSSLDWESALKFKKFSIHVRTEPERFGRSQQSTSTDRALALPRNHASHQWTWQSKVYDRRDETYFFAKIFLSKWAISTGDSPPKVLSTRKCLARTFLLAKTFTLVRRSGTFSPDNGTPRFHRLWWSSRSYMMRVYW